MKNTPPAVAFVSLGCPKNLVETELMAGNLLTGGWAYAADADDADLLVINTCCFIPEAREETAAAIKDALKWKKRRPDRVLAVAGCLVEWDQSAEWQKRFPEVDFWCGGNASRVLADVLKGKRAGGRTGCASSFIGDENSPRLQLTLPHLAYLKIADGCDNRCAYCAIPNIRGGLRSRDIGSVLSEAGMLVKNGVRELVLIAQDITAFGMDRTGRIGELAELLRRLDRLDAPGEFRVRLLYTHPAHYDGELIDVLASAKRVIPYLDIPMQHINDGILRRMGRRTDSAGIIGLLDRLRRNIPDLTIRTTFITGFPGEGEAEFAELEDFIREQRFDRMGVFAYSPEEGTPAADFPDQTPQSTAAARASRLNEIQQGILKEKLDRAAGSVVTAMIDSVRGGEAIGRGPADAPDIDTFIRIRGRGLRPGEFVRVRITGRKGLESTAEITENPSR